MMGNLTLFEAIDRFLVDAQNANKSHHTLRAYRSDLTAFTRVAPPVLQTVTTDHLRLFFAQHTTLQPATRARKQSAIASFFNWAYRHRLIDKNPMDFVERIQVEARSVLPLDRSQIQKVLDVIPSSQLRDRLLFRLLFETGLRINEALSLYIEDLDLTLDDEHITVTGKRQRRRTLLLDDPTLVALLKRYLKHCGYQQGPLFRAHKNYSGGALRYQSVQEKWDGYCQKAGVKCSLHQLRHSHATELINDGVSLATIRKRLGHQSFQTTLRYAQQADRTADNELRAWRRRQRKS